MRSLYLPGHLTPLRPLLLLGLVLAALVLRKECGHQPAIALATFNIRNYPESPRQEAGAFGLIRQLGTRAVAVQEICDPPAFAGAALVHLGPTWRFVYPHRGPQQRIGVLFDEETFSLRGTRTYEETVVYPEAKPAFEARLQPKSGGPVLRLLVVHLRAGGDGIPQRRQQLAALRGVLSKIRTSGDRLVLLGDFNATSAADRDGIAALAKAAEMIWASRGLRCTGYWERERDCLGTALDHVLTAASPIHTTARGPCETEGCGDRATCPIFHRDVSDHCPVVVEVPR